MMNLRCLKWAIPAGIVMWGLIFWAISAVAQPVYLDVCLSMTGTDAQARAAIRVLGLDKEMLREDAKLNDPLTAIYNHDAAIDFWERPILVFDTYDSEGNEITSLVFAANPIMRIRFISDEARAKAKIKIIDSPGLPAGLAKVPCPATRKWAGDP